MPIIKNGKDIDNFLKQVSFKMLTKTQDILYKALYDSITKYYAEYSPSLYSRKYLFLNSLIKTKIKQTKNELQCEVKIDEGYLSHVYPNTGKFHPSYPHDFTGRSATGRDIVNWANRKFPNDSFSGGNHGYTKDAGREDGFWDGTDELKQIMYLFKENLINQGIKVK